MSARVRALFAVAALTALPMIGLSQAAAAPLGVGSLGDPCAAVICPPSPTPSGSPSPTAKPSSSPSSRPSISPTPTATTAPSKPPTPARTFVPVTSPPVTYSPRPQATFSAGPTSTTSPVSGGMSVGGLAPDTSSPVASPVTAQPAAAKTGIAGSVDALLQVVVVLAVLLGLGGAAGIYLTRRRDLPRHEG